MTDYDPWSAKQHHCKSEAKEDHQLSHGGQSKRQKSSGPRSTGVQLKDAPVINRDWVNH